MDDRFEDIKKVLTYILILNLIVAFAKIVYGTLTDTLSMRSDGFHSFFDSISNIVGIVGVSIASRPPDKSHPYGHKKFETLASMFIAVLIIFVGFEIVISSMLRFTSEAQPNVTGLSFIVMIVTIAVNVFVTRYEHKQGTKLKSDILLADSMHTRSDIYVSLSVIVALVGIQGGYPIIDPIISLIIALVILKAGADILMAGSNTLCDAARIEEKVICDIAYEVEGVKECHKIRTRGTEGDISIDMHIRVRSDMPVVEAHALSHKVMAHLKERLDGVSDVMVHVGPFEEEKAQQK